LGGSGLALLVKVEDEAGGQSGVVAVADGLESWHERQQFGLGSRGLARLQPAGGALEPGVQVEHVLSTGGVGGELGLARGVAQLGVGGAGLGHQLQRALVQAGFERGASLDDEVAGRAAGRGALEQRAGVGGLLALA
jgi:hypothetical protein